MDQVATIHYLSEFPVFKKGDISLIDSVLQESEIREFEPGFKILQEWEGGEEGYIILEGSVDVYISAEYVATLGKGDVFGEYAPIFRQSRSATVIVCNHLRCIVLSKRSLLRLIGHGTGLNLIAFRRIAQNRKHRRGIFKR